MKTTDRIIGFAEQIAIEDNAKMKKLDAWEKYIKPLFKNHTGYDFNLSYVSMYKKEWKQWLNDKSEEFDKNYYN
jgi:hypothetical protein